MADDQRGFIRFLWRHKWVWPGLAVGMVGYHLACVKVAMRAGDARESELAVKGTVDSDAAKFATAYVVRNKEEN